MAFQGLMQRRDKQEQQQQIGKNGSIKNGQQQQQRVYLLDENSANQTYSVDPPLLLRPARIWRPSRERGRDDWREGKRRRRLIRMAALAGTIALGIGLFLLLWLALMLSSARKEQQFKEEAAAGNNDNVPSNSTPLENNNNNNTNLTIQIVATLPPSPIPSSSTFHPPKLPLSISKPPSSPGKGKRPPNFGKKLVQIHAGHLPHHQKIIRVTAPAKAIEFDRIEVNEGNGQGKASSTKVWAKLDKGGEWGVMETTTTASRMATKEGRKKEEMPRNGTEAEDGGRWRGDAGNGAETGPIDGTIGDGAIGTNSSGGRSRNGDEKEAEDYEDDDLFWMRDRPKTPFWTDGMPSMAPSEAPPVPTDGYEAKRPTIEFAPVRAEGESGEIGPTEKPEKGKEEEEGRRRTTEEEAQLRQELNEIIESVEREKPTGRGHFSSVEIHPVEIPFDPIQPPPPAESIVPIWRRPPPDEPKQWPAPPLPETKATNFSLQATVQTRKLEGKDLIKERHMRRRKRREAPVLVTALLDIGRGKWQRFTRHFDQYLGYLTNILLRIQNNIVVYCDPSVVAYLRALGDKMDWERIQIVEISLQELPFYKFRPEIEEIMHWEQQNWQREWDQQMRAHPETLYPDYDILVNSKPYFLYNATQISRFPRSVGRSEQFFAWLDAGYGHGSKSAIPMGIWAPQLHTGQITLVKLPSLVERVERYTLDKVYRKQRSVVSGGFLAGDDRVIRRFWTFFTKTFIELLDQRKVDDDQTTLLVTIQRYNSTFNLLQGGWFDAFKLLSSSLSSSQD